MIKGKVISILILLILCISVGGCTTNNQGGLVDNMKTTGTNYTEFGEKIATKEFLINTIGLKDNDLDGIDVDKILTHYEVTEEALKEAESKEFIIKSLKKLQKMLDEEGKVPEKVQENTPKIDYSYLVNAKEFTGKYPSFDDLKYLGFSATEGTGGYSCFIDFEKEIILYCQGPTAVYENINNYSKKEELTKEHKERFIESLNKAGVDKWDYKYEVKENNLEGNKRWYLGMEFKDGTIVSYLGINDSPDELWDVIGGIYK